MFLGAVHDGLEIYGPRGWFQKRGEPIAIWGERKDSLQMILLMSWRGEVRNIPLVQ